MSNCAYGNKCLNHEHEEVADVAAEARIRMTMFLKEVIHKRYRDFCNAEQCSASDGIERLMDQLADKNGLKKEAGGVKK